MGISSQPIVHFITLYARLARMEIPALPYPNSTGANASTASNPFFDLLWA
ncbi:MAG: hypothetical protein ACFB51_02945 [Anaerolineae bacterium]